MSVKNWKNKNVYVTGGSGFLGAWLVEELARAGAKPVVLMRDYVPESRLLSEGITENARVVRGELEDYFTVERLLNEYEIETVFHLAAQAIVPTANNNPLSTFESNIKGTWVLLEACRRNKQVKKIVVASSDKAYGHQKKLPYTEDMPLEGANPYDVSKSCADIIARMYFRHFRLPVCVTRCGNLFGGGDLNYSRLVPGTIRSILDGERPVIRSDGKYIRDYFYVKDAAEAMMTLAEKMDTPDIVGEAFNFSNEAPLSVLEMTREILTIMKKTNVRPVILDKAEGEIKNQYLSAAKAKKLLNWKARYDVKTALAETVKWYEGHHKSQ